MLTQDTLDICVKEVEENEERKRVFIFDRGKVTLETSYCNFLDTMSPSRYREMNLPRGEVAQKLIWIKYEIKRLLSSEIVSEPDRFFLYSLICRYLFAIVGSVCINIKAFIHSSSLHSIIFDFSFLPLSFLPDNFFLLCYQWAQLETLGTQFSSPNQEKTLYRQSISWYSYRLCSFPNDNHGQVSFAKMAVYHWMDENSLANHPNPQLLWMIFPLDSQVDIYACCCKSVFHLFKDWETQMERGWKNNTLQEISFEYLFRKSRTALWFL